jgi:Zn-dependent protease with chaperone function/type II secretory pathway pseudopilin PulG
MELVHKNEKTLFRISLVIGGLVWLLATVGTLGIILVYALIALLAYLFVHSGFIAHLRGNAVELSEQQFPDLYRQYRECCEALDIEDVPRAYLMMSDGVLNALATKFLKRHYVVLYSSVVEALRSRPEALRFYFGHELAHIKRGHLNLRWLLFPASILPLLGAAYRRAQEYTCDLHGLAASRSREDALAGLAVLGSGGERMPQMNLERFMQQRAESGGFWMSFHELTNDYPWLCKRMAHVEAASDGGKPAETPRRHFFAWLLALFVPRLGVGAGGGAISVVLMVVIIGILAAIAIPAYQDYTIRAKVAQAMPVMQQLQMLAATHVEENQALPETVEELGIAATHGTGPVSEIARSENGFELTLRADNLQIDGQTIALEAFQGDDGKIVWQCYGGSLDQKYRPLSCRQ